MDKRRYSGAIFLLLFLACSASSCGEYEQLEHRRLCERRADSLFNAHKDSLYKKAEAHCLSKYDEVYSKISDSLKMEKKKEIETLYK